MTIPNTVADLTSALDDRAGHARRDAVAGADGLSQSVERRPVECLNVRAAADAEGLVLTFLADGGWVQWLTEGLRLPADWREFDALLLTIHNGPDALRLRAMVLGKHCRLLTETALAADEATVLRLDLSELPLAQSKHAPYSPVGVRLQAQWGDTWPDEGALLLAGGSWPATAGNKPVSLRVGRMELVPRPDAAPPPVLDRYGQRIRGEWPGKIKCDADLQARRQEEMAWIAAHPVPPDRDRFGGHAGGPRFDATGFFRAQQDGDGRWWYVTPEGNPFWSFGVCCVNPGDVTVVTGRERLFAELPPRQGPAASAWGRCVIGEIVNRADWETVNFPLLNILGKWGSLEAWYEQNLRRLAAWGMNTVANWSAREAHRSGRMPYTPCLTSRFEGLPRVCGKMPDVFDPAWEPRLSDEFARLCAAYRDDPWCLGYFCDNEMAWLGLAAGGFLDAAPEGAARAAFIDHARRRYSDDLSALNQDWGSTFQRWDDLRQLTPPSLPGGSGCKQSVREFAGAYAERYFAMIARTLRRHDPNHLYLGCRFVRGRCDDLICAAAGRWCDVVSVNSYALWPPEEQFAAWHETCNHKPIQLGEYNVPRFSAHMVPYGWPALTPEQRQANLPGFMRRWITQPFSVGAHHFQLLDMPATGRPFGDAGNGADCILDITDTPHADSVAAMREIGENLHRWRLAATRDVTLGRRT